MITNYKKTAGSIFTNGVQSYETSDMYLNLTKDADTDPIIRIYKTKLKIPDATTKRRTCTGLHWTNHDFLLDEFLSADLIAILTDRSYLLTYEE